MRRCRRGAKAATLLLLALASVTGCGGTQSPHPVTGPPQAAARIGLIDFQIVTTAKALVAGAVTLQVTNAGSTAHNLRVQGDHTDARTRVMAPGESAVLTVDLAGEHRVELTCTLPGHIEQGMHLGLAVGPGG